MDLNHVTLTGIVERDPITRFADHGTQQVSFTLRLTEAGPAGQAFTLFVPCEAYSQAGEQAGELAAGDAVLVAGKLKWTGFTDKQGQKRTSLCVLARLVKRLAPALVPWRRSLGGPGERTAEICSPVRAPQWQPYAHVYTPWKKRPCTCIDHVREQKRRKAHHEASTRVYAVRCHNESSG